PAELRARGAQGYRSHPSVVAGREPDRPAPVLVTELEPDRAAKVDQLGFAEQQMQPGPERVPGAVGVVGDRLGPLECRALALGATGDVPRRRGTRKESEAELLQILVHDAASEDVVAGELVRLEHRGDAGADLVRGARKLSDGRSSAAHPGPSASAARPAVGCAGSSACPTAQVLITRC